MFKEVLGGSGNENELRFHVREFVFCILEDHNSNRHHNPKGNLQPFMEVLHPVLPPSIASVPVDVPSADVRSDARAQGFVPLRGTTRFQRMLIRPRGGRRWVGEDVGGGGRCMERAELIGANE